MLGQAGGLWSLGTTLQFFSSHCLSALPIFPLRLFLSAPFYIFPPLPFSLCFSFVITQPADSGGGGFSGAVGLSSRPCLMKLILQNR